MQSYFCHTTERRQKACYKLALVLCYENNERVIISAGHHANTEAKRV